MSITDNEEFKKRMDSDCRGWYAYEPSEQSCYRQGAEAAETILTAQHDKEMEEFEIWKEENAFMTFYDPTDSEWMITHKGRVSNLSFAELLALFRNRK